MKNTALKVAGIIFLLISLMHLLRLAFREQAIKAGFTEPAWFSILCFIFPLLLSLWMFKTTNK